MPVRRAKQLGSKRAVTGLARDDLADRSNMSGAFRYALRSICTANADFH